MCAQAGSRDTFDRLASEYDELNNSWPSRLHRGSTPPPLETIHFPSDAFGNGCT
jgi:hypothetical protein